MLTILGGDLEFRVIVHRLFMLPIISIGIFAVGFARDRASHEIHFVSSEGAGFVAEDVFDLEPRVSNSNQLKAGKSFTWPSSSARLDVFARAGVLVSAWYISTSELIQYTCCVLPRVSQRFINDRMNGYLP